MIEDLNIDLLEKLAGLTFQFGPFLFALIFTIWISRWGYKKYNEVCKRKGPPASDDEKRTVKNYFQITTYFGLALVIVSVVWWWHSQGANHIYAGRIEGLRDYHATLSHTLFIKPVHQAPADIDLPVFHQDHFLITQHSPFREAQCFDITIIKRDNSGQSEPIIETFEIPYVKEGYVRLKYSIDPSTGKPGLKVISKEPFLSSLEIVRSAFALDIGDFIKKSNKKIYEEQKKVIKNTRDDIKKNQELSISEHIMRLQNERTNVSGKIDALNSLNALSEEKLNEYLIATLVPEPLPITLLDLTRHTDETLSSKAGQFVESHIDIIKYLDRVIEKNSFQPEELAEMILRLDEKTAKSVLDNFAVIKKYPWAIDLRSKLEKQEIKLNTLIPTASYSGDRYYVEATWDSSNKEVVDCLTALFHIELIHDRTFEQEKEIMKDRSERWVYWYSKNWALLISKKIEACGAASNFEGF